MRYLPLFLLLATFSAQAESLMIASDQEQAGALANIPKILAEEMASVGAISPKTTAKEEVPGVLELKASDIICERSSKGGPAKCSLKGQGEGRTSFTATGGFIAAMEALHRETEGLVGGSCEPTGACRLSIAYLFCTINTEFADEKKGKFSCGIMGR